MKLTRSPIWHGPFVCGKVFLCVLLAGLFLYNPFLAADHGHNSLTVCHPASYRATVASSEVEQFAPPSARAAAFLPDLDVVRLLIPELATSRSDLLRPFREEGNVSPQAGFSSSLWFRPPPAV